MNRDAKAATAVFSADVSPPLYLIGTYHRQPLIFCAIYTNTLQKLVVEIDSIMDTTLLMLCTERQIRLIEGTLFIVPKKRHF